MEWITGPQAIERLETWCAANGTTLSKLAGTCVPVVYRSTLTKWRKGGQPECRMWARFVAAMEKADALKLNALLGG